MSGHVSVYRNPIIFMLDGINCRFSNISLNKSVIPVEGTINACRVLQVDEEHLEAGYRAPEAPDVPQMARGDLSLVRTDLGITLCLCLF
jgi:hypothetical protein